MPHLDQGMLWFEADKKPADAIQDAAAYYRKKYQKPANVAIVSKRQKGEVPELVGNIVVHRADALVPNNYWIGVGGDES